MGGYFSFLPNRSLTWTLSSFSIYQIIISTVCSKDCDSGSGASPACSENLDPSDFVYDSALACCKAKISWLPDSDLCAAASIAGSAADAPATNKYWADYSTGAMRCVKDCDDTSTDPSCADSKLESTVGVALFDDAKKCCAAKFGWFQPELCLALVESGGEATNTGKWEANYMEEMCTQDCPVSSASPLCGGTPKDLSQPLYDSMEECCKQKFSWMGDSCMCKADPALAVCVEAATKWYASDKENGKCKRNCDTSDDECGGLAEPTQLLFDSAKECCDPSKNTRFTGQSAIQNCECQGIDPDDTTLCPAAAGDGSWYIKGTNCVKNCPTDSGDSECGGLAESWQYNFFDSASACCGTSQFQGIEEEDCIG